VRLKPTRARLHRSALSIVLFKAGQTLSEVVFSSALSRWNLSRQSELPGWDIQHHSTFRFVDAGCRLVQRFK